MLHYGNNNPNFEYTLCDHVLSSADSANDLGVIRTTNLLYDEHCTNIIRRTNSICAFIYVILLRVMHRLCLVFLLLT